MDPVVIQRRYYACTACEYDDLHLAVEHDRALGHVIGLAQWLGATSLLDTGCGTGRAMRIVGDALPSLRVRGNDPSRALLDIASSRFGVSAADLDCASSESLPYADGAFDVVVATGVMHHVQHPERVIAEMLRVARQAIFVSDCNMYGQGPLFARVAKLALAGVGQLNRVNRIRRGGNAWVYTEGDGVAWNYSVYDSLAQVQKACSDVLVIPTVAISPRAARHPLLWSSHGLLCGFRTPLPVPPLPRRELRR